MFVSTFYSYKGGVGRTFALANVAVDLAKSGRKVLLVDFDLEAPGLDTFSLFENKNRIGGIVEYVTDYIQRKSPPKVSDYVYEAPMYASEDAEVSGKIWVMPAGRRNASYDHLLAGIHWKQLYDEMEGFYLFEDLKEQWESVFAPDYVLIDSRTGHTDVGGICTRQLADLVVFLFTPNEQNLKGLPPIVNAIRQESNRLPDRKIETCFVASNVPTLDDEEGILRDLMREFSKAFGKGGGRQRILAVQRYDSLQLLNQNIFTLSRPKSRLAKQYNEITQCIVESNLEDREGVLEYLKNRVRFERNEKQHRFNSRYNNDRLLLILAQFPDDPEILLWVSRCYAFQSKPAEVISLLEKAQTAEMPRTKAAVHLELANALLTNQQIQPAAKHLEAATEINGLGAEDIRVLFRLWQLSDKLPNDKLMYCIKNANLSDEDYEMLLMAISHRRGWQHFVVDLLLENEPETVFESAELLHILLFSLMGSQQFGRIQSVASKLLALDGESIPNLFNSAMAEWAVLGKPSVDSFKRLLAILGDVEDRDDANFSQCLSLAYAVVHDKATARRYLANAYEQNKRVPISKISCWRYQEVSQDEFENDVSEMQSFIEEGSPPPLFLRSSN